MNALYEKNEMNFALLWIGIYVVLVSAADSVSLKLGLAKSITFPLCAILAGVLLLWVKKNGLNEKYGLQKVKTGYRKYLYFLPLVFLASSNLWGGVAIQHTPLETALYVGSMLCVGIIEEVIFRGFLFKALCKDSVKQAVAISSITFGFGHIVNLLNGAPIALTLLQICYAVAFGFLFTVIFLKSKSLVPCIVTHSTINSLSAFAAARTPAFSVAVSVVLVVVSLAYAAWILRAAGEEAKAEIPAH